jgi:diaminohydroxyphosphoribosylaminopyrimidine deaminase/5-amino-6-(5-phosphoribosylamino)uracil reductase
LVEGGPAAATALLEADRADRLLLYRAPIVVGEGRGIAMRLPDLSVAHGRWRLADRRDLGPDVLEEYRRAR